MFTGLRHTVVLVLGCLLVMLALAGCGGTTKSTPAPAVASTLAPTPDIEATVEARVQAVVKVTAEATPQAVSTTVPIPSNPASPMPQPTYTPLPTYPPLPTYTPLPTPTKIPFTPTPTHSPTPTPIVPLHTQYQAAISDLDSNYFQLKEAWEKQYHVLIDQWLLSTGDESVESQTRFYDWLLQRNPQNGDPIPWSDLAPMWDVVLDVAEIYETDVQPGSSNNAYMDLYAKAPALFYHLSDWNPNLKDAVFGLVIARYYSGNLGSSGYAGNAVLSSLTGIFDRYLVEQAMQGGHPTTFINHLSLLSPARYGKSE